jgi:hypothetical protein
VDEAHRLHSDEILPGVSPVFRRVLVDELEFSVLDDVDAGPGGVLQGPVEALQEKGIRPRRGQLFEFPVQLIDLTDQLLPDDGFSCTYALPGDDYDLNSKDL